MADLKQQAGINSAAALPAAAVDLRLISGLAREAGQVGLRFFGRSPKVWIKEGNSPVTEADFAVDRFLKEKLLAARPDYGWISEETADDRPPAAYKRYFIVDPIDGTRGFIEHNPQWCVSVAVVENGRPIAGALDCPALAEHYTAAVSGKALLNNAEMLCAPADGGAVKAALRVACRKSALQKLPPAAAGTIARAAHIPSLAYRLALLARGQLDAVFVRPGCHDWDIAAADLILALSGGALTDQAGQPLVYGKPPFSHGFLLGAAQNSIQELLHIVSCGDLG